MQNTVFKIFIASILLMVGVPVESAQARPAGNQRIARLEQARHCLRQAEQRIRVVRGAGEFVGEIDLFDNHLYGRLNNRNEIARTGLLRGMIQARNVELHRMMENAPQDRAGEGTAVLTPDVQEFYENVHSLESQIAGMISELNVMESSAARDVATELLHGSLWVGDSKDALLLDTLGADLQKALGRARALVDSLENMTRDMPAPAKVQNKNERPE